MNAETVVSLWCITGIGKDKKNFSISKGTKFKVKESVGFGKHPNWIAEFDTPVKCWVNLKPNEFKFLEGR